MWSLANLRWKVGESVHKDTCDHDIVAWLARFRQFVLEDHLQRARDVSWLQCFVKLLQLQFLVIRIVD